MISHPTLPTIIKNRADKTATTIQNFLLVSSCVSWLGLPQSNLGALLSGADIVWMVVIMFL